MGTIDTSRLLPSITETASRGVHGRHISICHDGIDGDIFSRDGPVQCRLSWWLKMECSWQLLRATFSRPSRNPIDERGAQLVWKPISL